MTPARSTPFARCVALTAAMGWSRTTTTPSPAPPATQTPAATTAPADPPYDTTLLLTPHPEASMYVNFDYGHESNIGTGSQHWAGVALAPRTEWFNDANGFSTGTKQKVKEFTMTAEFKAGDAFLTRLEYRRDWSDAAFSSAAPTACIAARAPCS